MQDIKLYEGVIIEHKGETIKLDYIPQIWEQFGWDTENDKDAKACALAITRELICYGDFKTQDANGREIYIKLIPPKEEE